MEPTAAEKRDYSDDEIKAMTPDEKRKLFSGSFKFKTDLLTSKILLMQAGMQNQELRHLTQSADYDAKEYFYNLQQCAQQPQKKRMQCLIKLDCQEELRNVSLCQM